MQRNASARTPKCRRGETASAGARHQTPFGGGIVRDIGGRILAPQHEAFDRAEAENDLADDEGCERATRHLK